MENKKLYICGTTICNKQYKKMYASIETLKLDNLLWHELGIYEFNFFKINCIEEPALFNGDIPEGQTDIEEIVQSETTAYSTVNTFFGKISQAFKRKQRTDWSDISGNKEFKWKGKCDACGEHKSNLTVVHSATLSGVTVCRECRLGNLRD